MSAFENIASSKWLPVITIPSEDLAVPLAEIFADVGLPVMEITLRTPAALPAIGAIKKAFPDMTVGAGTVWTEADLRAATQAGADFIVSPGTTAPLRAAMQASDKLCVPGAQTVSEIAALEALGFHTIKFFPAEAAGGPRALKAIASVFPALEFIPTGGIGPDNQGPYREIHQVVTLGGSWITPEHMLANEAWELIRQQVETAVNKANAVA